MKLYWVKTNKLIKTLFSKWIWDIPNTKKVVYLTFDDGPTPEVTSWVLDELNKYNFKATFFCIGDNIRKYPVIFKKIISEGHAVGNHTFNHLNGWKTSTQNYIDNTELCQEIIDENRNYNSDSKIFRPPYGKIKTAQSRALLKMGYKIIMWDVLSADFDEKISNEECLNNVIMNLQPGSIIVFHDSIKAFEKLKYVLPATLQYLQDNNYETKVL
ncbi:polysaccharide deacetylase family protein [Flavobacterium sp. FPG59]|jgi:peptidoglycan/xylan/chitin deacetylase (PgdA/CDA1 family)|uniref:polysaccharide deacetylase family protein n=1 Tax=Flavobacterium sp. FPG59 TaxID=1929267 RepID=UPI000A3AA862|nr:polysaccharide deacetylase family protein [Flavobacterium sp. FPG59]OUD35709.1 polysaccharide deacetylase family protein [Flavobacterium sp. FPG59]